MDNCSHICEVEIAKKDILSSLRKQYYDGNLEHFEYIMQASVCYLEIQKPKRAQALLNSIQARVLTKQQKRDFIACKKAIMTQPLNQASSCTLNMIAKNEERNITEALNSIDILMDEIVICDTGSKDQTLKMAEPFGIKIIKDPWQNDFSRARNAALAVSTSKWILWMDADDRLAENAGTFLKQLLHDGKKQAVAFCIANEQENNLPVEFLQIRLFPNQTGILFEQSIHEQIMYSLKRKNIPFVQCPEIRMHHIGYKTKIISRKKAFRNKNLLLEEIKQNPDDPMLQMYLGDCYLSLDNLEKAKKCYYSVTNSISLLKLNPDVFIQAHINLAGIFIQQDHIHNAQRYLFKSITLDSTRVDAYFALGKIFLRQKREDRALDFFLKSALIKPQLRMTVVNNLKIKLEAIFYISEILIEFQHFQSGENILIKTIQCYPFVPRLYTQLGKVLAKQNKLKEALNNYKKSLELDNENNQAALIGIQEIYARIGMKIEANRYPQKALITMC